MQQRGAARVRMRRMRATANAESKGTGIARTHSRCCTCACLSLGGGCLGVRVAPFRVSWARWELRPCGNHGTRESWLCEFRALPFVPNSIHSQFTLCRTVF